MNTNAQPLQATDHARAKLVREAIQRVPLPATDGLLSYEATTTPLAHQIRAKLVREAIQRCVPLPAPADPLSYEATAMPVAHLIRREMQPLLRAYFDELKPDVGVSTFDLDWIENQLKTVERTGFHRAVVLLRGDELVGFASFLIMKHPQFSFTFATSSTLYIKPEHRRGWAGLKLVAALEREAKAAGATVMFWSVKTSTPAEALFRRRGYKASDITFAKEL